MCFVNVLLFAH